MFATRYKGHRHERSKDATRLEAIASRLEANTTNKTLPVEHTSLLPSASAKHCAALDSEGSQLRSTFAKDDLSCFT